MLTDAGPIQEGGSMKSYSPRRSALWLLLAFEGSSASAQTSPFATGAAAFQTNFLAILTPVAVIAVMSLGVGAWFNRISWSWAAGGALGILLVFGAPQIVAWVRGLAGV
jgi:type IV secretion system protein VirB2